MKKYTKTVLIPLFLFYLISSTAQPALYSPKADFSFPRTIVDAAELDEVRNGLSNELKATLFKSNWNYALSDIPGDNDTDLNRTIRAQLAREIAFVLLMKKKVVGDHIVDFGPEEIFQVELTQKATRLLEEMNVAIGFQAGWSFYHEWQFRSKELIHYLIAYDLLKGSGLSEEILLLAKTNLMRFAENLYQRVMAGYPSPIPGFPELDFFQYNINNHGIMIGSALGLAGLVLYDENDATTKATAESWLSAGMWNIDNTLWREGGLILRVSEPGILAGYAEGPAYFNYCFANAFPFIRSLWNILPDGAYEFQFRGNSKAIRHPWYDENYHNLYDWMVRLRMPNGHLPSIHDSPTSFQTQITALSGKENFNVGTNAYNLNSIWIRSQYISTLQNEGSYPESLFQAMPDAGSLVFRSSWDDPKGIYLHLIGKNGIPLYGAKAHHQADAMGFQLYFNGEILALDAGYPGAPYRKKSSAATSHNLILVNGKGPGEPFSEWVSEDNSVYIEHFFDGTGLDYGELRGGWNGAEMTRKVLFVENKYFVMADFLQANRSVSFQYQLHGRGLFGAAKTSKEGAFVPDFIHSQGIYSTASSNLLSFVTARGGVDEYNIQQDSIAVSTNSFKTHSKMLATKRSVASTEFLSVLYPYTADGIKPEVEKFPENEDYTAIKIKSENGWDYIAIQSDTNMISLHEEVEEIQVNGKINFLSVSGSGVKSFFIQDGNQIIFQDQPIFKADQKLDINVERISGRSISGFVNKAASIQLYSEVPLIVKAGRINNIYYDLINKMSVIHFSGAGNFELEFGEAEIISAQENVDTKGISEIQLFPNPIYTSSNLVFYSEQRTSLDITVFDLSGARIYHSSVPVKAGTNQHQLDLSHLAPSMYLLRLQQNDHSYFTKIVKK